jgi:hypothetical protein
MKVPATWETEVSSAELDFATRSQFSERVVDWTLIRGPSMSSAFPGARLYLRDIGLNLGGDLYGFRYAGMIGNGLGPNFYVGGREKKGFLFANAFGAYLYAIRLSFDPMVLVRETFPGFPLRSLRIGGHAAWNVHDEVILNDERTVTDLDRRSWSWDVRADVLGRVRLGWMMGGGIVDDDYDRDGKIDYRYRGWEARCVVVILPGWIEVGFRWDAYRDEKSESGADETMHAYTAGVTLLYEPHLRLQINTKWKILDSRTNPDLDDDVFVLAAQLRF